MAPAPLNRGRRRLVATALASCALLLAACGDTLQTAAEQVEDLPEFVEPEVLDEASDSPADEPAEAEEAEVAGDDPGEHDDAGTEDTQAAEDEDTVGDDEEAAAEQGAGDDPGTDTDGCALPTSPQAEVRSEDEYLDVLGAVNLGLEEVVFELDEALLELEDGISDGPSLAAELRALLERYHQLTEPVAGLAPLEGAEDWHADAVSRFEAVCLAVLDGLAGIEDGDEERFAAFVAALREFPTLGNELHATMMVGPFEAG